MTSQRDVDAERGRFECAFRDHYDAVLAYALARSDPETAKDAAAATFLVAWRRRADLPGQALPWLLAVTRRTLADQRRSRERQQALARRLAAQPEASDVEPDPAERLGGPSQVMDALRMLSPADRELLTLVAWDGLTNTEVAAVLGRPRMVVGVRLHRARQRFRGALAAADQLTGGEPGQRNMPSPRPGPGANVTVEDR
jgi:RNA polymerase sigma-70 factor, ECF subfamily